MWPQSGCKRRYRQQNWVTTGDHLKENMSTAESQIPAVDPVAHMSTTSPPLPTHEELQLTWKVFLENYIHAA